MSGLKKDLGLWQGMGLLATSLLGTGIFVVPATAASLAGGASLWAWVLLIVLVLPIAFTFARLGRRYPHAGGAPHLIGLAFGNGAERFSAFTNQPDFRGVDFFVYALRLLQCDGFAPRVDKN